MCPARSVGHIAGSAADLAGLAEESRSCVWGDLLGSGLRCHPKQCRERAMLLLHTGGDYFSRLSTTGTCAALVHLRKTEISARSAMAPAAPSCLPPAQVSPMPRAEPAAPAFLADPTPTSHLPAAGIINTSRPSTARGQAALPLPDGTSRGGRLAGCWRRRTSRAGGRPGRRGLLPQPLHLAGPACQTRPPVA